MMIGIIAAMDEEIEAILKIIKNYKKEEKDSFIFYKSKIKEKNIIISKCGIGKSNAAILTSYMINKYHIDYIINLGCAGALNKDIKIADVIIGEKVADWDIDVPSKNWIRSFENKNISFDLYPLKSKMKKYIKGKDIIYGNIVSGESFVYKKSQVNTILKYFPQVLCVEMEGSSIARTCETFNVECIIIRSISDNTLIKDDYKKFDFNLKDACDNAAKITMRIVNYL